MKEFTIPGVSFARGFSFPFSDRAWVQKIALGGALLLVPIFGVTALAGWQLEILRRVIRQEPEQLPDWEDLSGMVHRGLEVSLISSVLLIPFLGLTMVFVAIPLVQFDVVPSNAATTLSACVAILALGYLFLAAFVGPAALGLLAETGSVKQALRPREWLRLISAAPGPFLAAFLGLAGATLVGVLGYFACVVGSLFTGAYAYAVVAHLYGQAHRSAMARLSPPI